MMAIAELEDLVGSVEVMIFPKTYERYKDKLKTDALVFIKGHVSTEDEADSKLIAQDVYDFGDVPKTLWLKFEDMDTYNAKWEEVSNVLSKHKGVDSVIIRVIKEDKMKVLPKYMNVEADEELTAQIEMILGERTAAEKFERDLKKNWRKTVRNICMTDLQLLIRNLPMQLI